MSAVERLIRYCKIDTQSNPESGTSPSSQKQFDLANVLVEELKEMGSEDAHVDEYCYVYGHLPANTDKNCKRIGFIAHMDTAPDYTGTNVNPRIIENYDGGDIELCPGVVTRVDQFPQMKKLKGMDLVVTDGSTLLGADDKAGIVAIMETIEYLLSHSEVEHGPISIGFTPDEEIGEGPKHFNYEEFGADFAYTMDGGEIEVYSDETFNAAKATVKFQGFSIHPGSAKDKMINASNVAFEFHRLLPEYMRPEHTEGRDGFIHLGKMSGNTDQAELQYILRDHNRTKLEKQIERMKDSVLYLNQIYGEGTVAIEIENSYRNMKEIIDQHPEVARIAKEAIQELGYVVECEAIRGGTDGAELSYHGLPCPNLGTGGGNFHGRYEYCCVQQLEQASQLIRLIVDKTLKETNL